MLVFRLVGLKLWFEVFYLRLLCLDFSGLLYSVAAPTHPLTQQPFFFLPLIMEPYCFCCKNTAIEDIYAIGSGKENINKVCVA